MQAKSRVSSRAGPYRERRADGVPLAVVRGTITRLRDVDGLGRRRARAVTSDLTARERDILRLMAGGASNFTICRALHLSPKTVETHVRHIFIKLDLRPDGALDRRVLAVIAYLQAQRESAAA